MTMPLGIDKEVVDKLCKLQKSLYDFKQLLRVWFDRFVKVMRKYGYKKGHSDHTLFFKQNANERRRILIVYVDIILNGDNLVMLKAKNKI